MSPMDCRDKVKLSLSDESGILRVKALNIVDAPECQELAESLRRRLLGRSLEDIDVSEIREMSCRGDGLCGRVIADIVEEYQAMFVRNGLQRRQDSIGEVERISRGGYRDDI